MWHGGGMSDGSPLTRQGAIRARPDPLCRGASCCALASCLGFYAIEFFVCIPMGPCNLYIKRVDPLIGLVDLGCQM